MQATEDKARCYRSARPGDALAGKCAPVNSTKGLVLLRTHHAALATGGAGAEI
jgi:hypothetical protein